MEARFDGDAIVAAIEDAFVVFFVITSVESC